MPRYRLFASDLDGTLIGPDLVISQRTHDALTGLALRGCTLVLATGRMFQATLPFAQSLGISTPLITYQGAWIRDAQTHTDLWHQKLTPALVREILAFLAPAGFHLNMYVDDRLFIRELSDEAKQYIALARVEATVVADWEEVLALGAPTKLVAMGPEAKVLDWVAKLDTTFNSRLKATQSQATYLEIVSPLAGKGAALALLAETLGIARAEIVAVGDGLNDLDMLEYAGLGVAMGNASSALKAKADRVTSSLKADGVAALIDALIAEGSL